MKIGISLPIRDLKNDLGAIKAFAQAADDLGLNHLRVPDQVIRPGSGHLHEPLTLMSYIAAVTERIELVPSVIVLPSRQTALVAKQAAEIDVLSGGRLRLGVGVGGNKDEYEAMGADFHTRGERCEEQLELLKLLWTRENVDFEGKWDSISGNGIDPLPVQQPIPVWIGAMGTPSARILRRIGRQADGWFVLASPEDYPSLLAEIDREAEAAGRSASDIGAEAGVAVVGPREAEWKDRVVNWRKAGLSHVCLRTLGGDLKPDEHIGKMREAYAEVPSD